MSRLITGIIRRVDDLGRIHIPKELRRKLNLQEGAALEEILTPEGLLLKPYCTHDDLLGSINACLDLLTIDEGKSGYEKADYELLVALLKQSRKIVLDNRKRLQGKNGPDGKET